MRKNQHGLGAIAALVVLVLLAALAAAIVSLSATQSTTAAQDVLSARAWQASRAGTEWGAFQALNNGNWGAAGPCTNAPRTVTLNLAPASAFNVTVTCTPYNYNEGETTPPTRKTVRVYRIVAVACPDTSVACPDNAAVGNPTYVERTRSVIATD